ncbi:MAG: hypothetical protein LT070_10275 [Solirubrobacteraceae bacterium]|nr:hypothetical protein [Solirubrobacteraceae bacterium]
MENEHEIHGGGHEHLHGPGCGHTAVVHAGHIDFLHAGHLHHAHGDHVDDHVIAVDAANPDGCRDAQDGVADEPGHVHGPGCGHEQVPHGGHVDYLVDGRLHHPHGDHCDDHGPLSLA